MNLASIQRKVLDVKASPSRYRIIAVTGMPSALLVPIPATETR